MNNNNINLKHEQLKLMLITATFGTIGFVMHFIPLSSPAIVFYRALIGGTFIIFICLISNKKIDIKSMKDNFIILILTSFFMGLNWVFQFEAFRVSSVAIGTVCYNTMPIFLLIIASFVFNEKITFKNIICIAIATLGIFLVSNVMYTGIKSNEVLGCIYGLLGAIFYALIVIYNRKLNHITTHDKIIFQFILSSFIMYIYVVFIQGKTLLFDNNLNSQTKVLGLICLIILCIFHTGFCYIHYFDAVSILKSETVAIMTYLDPVVALTLSYFVLKEKTNHLQMIGAILILSSTLINEFIFNKKQLTIDN